ncbi:MAG: pirin family protein [Deltaproteobacteria bacterium]|nr:pirin family protein [Candidatus Zymogenaceae bacterium]
MFQIIRARQRHFVDFGWLKTYWLFSFSFYYDPHNIRFGPLRVFNDDVIDPNSGFDTHSHREMEIVTIPLEGEITHEDSLGNRTVIAPGDVQCMSAGNGVSHSECNLTEDPAHLYQIWFYPDEPRLEPGYDQRSFTVEDHTNRLCVVASGRGDDPAVELHVDATIYMSRLDPETALTHDCGEDRRVFVYLSGGMLDINGKRLVPGDQARIDPDGPLELVSRNGGDTAFILIDVPSSRAIGYPQEILWGPGRKEIA